MLPSPGYAEFQIDGQTVRLEPTVEGKSLFFDFRDTVLYSRRLNRWCGAVSQPYRSAQQRHLQPRGTGVLDFNYAHNPPCGYNAITANLPAAHASWKTG